MVSVFQVLRILISIDFSLKNMNMIFIENENYYQNLFYLYKNKDNNTSSIVGKKLFVNIFRRDLIAALAPLPTMK